MTEIDGELKKWGNSLAVRVPLGVAKTAGLSEGDAVHVTIERAASGGNEFFGILKRFPPKRNVSYESFKAEERRRERADERRLARRLGPR